jgi:hypothetical protein
MAHLHCGDRLAVGAALVDLRLRARLVERSAVQRALRLGVQLRDLAVRRRFAQPRARGLQRGTAISMFVMNPR